MYGALETLLLAFFTEILRYFDGSWKTGVSKRRKVFHDMSISVADTGSSKLPKNIPSKIFIGQFGADGWATKSGTKMLSFGDTVRIERQRMRMGENVPSAGGKSKGKASAAESSQQVGATGSKSIPLRQRKTQDIIVRFTNSRGEEIGRLSQDTASFMSTLIDQRIAFFEGICIHAAEKIRTNDTIDLQLNCYLLKESFENSSFRPADTNRVADIFAAKETQDERVLRLRQVALVKLFQRMNLEPKSTNLVTQKHKAAGILQAAEIAEQHEITNISTANKARKTVTSSAVDESGDDENSVVEGKELEEDQLNALYEKAQSFNSDTPESEPADTFAMSLRRYQKQALHWFLSKEKSTDYRANESIHPLWEEYEWPNTEEDHKRAIRDLGQDKFYVNPYSGELSLKFPKQEQNCLGGILADEMGLGKTIEMLSLIHTHRPEPSGPTLPPANSFGRLQRQSEGVVSAPLTTLVVAPMSLLAQWESEAEVASKPGTLKTLVYYDSQKKQNLQTFCNASNAGNVPNLIITSYGVVLSEFGQVVASGGKRGAHGGLFSVKFLRIILDEAHHIKNRTSKSAKACYELSADHRWVLTGTPIVNRLEDLFSLVRFLRVEPWSNFSFWKTFITVPFEEKDFIRALDVVQTVLEPLVLRRTKEMKTLNGEPLVPLPKKTTEIVYIKLSKAELDVYRHIEARARSDLARSIEMGTVLKSYTNIFAHVLRLRQACCHPILIRKKEIYSVQENDALPNLYGANALKEIRDNVENECPMCLSDPIPDQTVTGCLHAACKGCWVQLIETAKAKQELPKCVKCREPINERDLFEVIRNESPAEEVGQPENSQGQADITLRRINSRSSAKVEMLIEKLSETERSCPERKSCVFSQFTTFLDIIEKELQRRRIKFLRFDGSMSQQKRAEVVSTFKMDQGPNILLLSLRAGGVGLNLTTASQVFMMDPWWSFAVEAQAIDRVHRMGQTSEVMVYRFVVEGTVEERIVHTIQARKKFIASSLGMMNDEEKKKAKMEDIKILLGR
ncbi:unnamed protein product [Tuber melanosporum]|uniref:(Perigord truffle) hypothetical protein n=1 Tax=Tuber melanosporum (strain Mel28) TaxID=656061 RepID=D5GMV9_TUBMM|nr:uncharacterized protein GSTUM_00010961001 [Tuber melanosporum]CAZ85852.1 unnamed protein product [Tuber melanosporum]